MLQIIHDDNLHALASMDDESFELIYIDPPFNTGKVQRRQRLETVADESGDRIGFGGRRYRSRTLASGAFPDRFPDFTEYLLGRRARA